MTGVEAPRETRYHQLVVLAPDGIMIHDGERVLLANNAAARLAGATQLDQLIGAPIEGFLKPPFLRGVEEQLLTSGDLSAVVTPIRDTFHRLDGTTIEVDVTAIAFMDGRRTSVHLVIRDVTDRLAVEDASRLLDLHLQQAQRMEAVGALAGGVAHEVNNMMSVVLGFGEFMLRDAELSAARAEDVREIMKAAERAAGVTRQLLAFSRRAFYQPAAFDLGAAVLAVEPALRRLLGASRGLAIDVAGAPEARADASQLEQVLVNLALNARDAMGENGTLRIAAIETEVWGGASAYGSRDIPPGRYALLTVSDTGTGMDAETLSRLFEPFYTTKAVGHGTGLGLAAVYGILRQNNAFVTVESELGSGTRFRLYLPLAAEMPTLAAPAAPESAAVRPTQPDLTILLVEDEPAVRAIAARSLEFGGFRVIQAADGAAALEAVARNGPPSLVLTDLMMPGIGGAELAQRLRKLWPDLPILFMSGYSTEDLQSQGIAGAADVTIQKPFTLEGLITSVAASLARSGPATEATSP
jgi:two-component system, cell cycle sensor histidine kinase and response regulator CckA